MNILALVQNEWKPGSAVVTVAGVAHAKQVCGSSGFHYGAVFEGECARFSVLFQRDRQSKESAQCLPSVTRADVQFQKSIRRV